MVDRILTKHPQDKHGVNIDRAKDELVKEAILRLLARGEVTLEGLRKTAERTLHGELKGSASWYVMAVKLDLEARRVIERVPASHPQRLRLRK